MNRQKISVHEQGKLCCTTGTFLACGPCVLEAGQQLHLWDSFGRQNCINVECLSQDALAAKKKGPNANNDFDLDGRLCLARLRVL